MYCILTMEKPILCTQYLALLGTIFAKFTGVPPKGSSIYDVTQFRRKICLLLPSVTFSHENPTLIPK